MHRKDNTLRRAEWLWSLDAAQAECNVAVRLWDGCRSLFNSIGGSFDVESQLWV